MGVIAQRYFSISTYLPTYISYEIHLDHLATGVVILLLPKFPRLLHTYDFRTFHVWDHPYITSGHIVMVDPGLFGDVRKSNCTWNQMRLM